MNLPSDAATVDPASGNLSAKPTRTEKTVVQVLDFVPSNMSTAEQFLLSFRDRLAERGWRVVFVFASEPTGPFRDRLKDAGTPYLLCDFPLTFSRGNDLGRRLCPFAPDVIQTHYVSKFEGGLWILKRNSGARWLIVTDRSSGIASRKSALGQMLSRARTWWSARFVDRIIAVSDFVRRRNVVDVHFPEEKVGIVYNGVDTVRFSPAAPPNNEISTIGYAGQLIPEKGVATLLRAVKLLADRGQFVRLRIAGEGEQGDELRRQCVASGIQDRVEFLGRIAGVENFYRSSDIVVVPSEWEEAFGFVAAEAIACGACVIASNAGGLPEVIGADQTAGAIFSKGDAGELANKLTELFADPARCERIRAAARQRAIDNFSLGRMVDGYLAYFSEIEAK